MKESDKAQRKRSDETWPTRSLRSSNMDENSSDADLQGEISSSRKVIVNHFYPHHTNTSPSEKLPMIRNNRVKFAHSLSTTSQNQNQTSSKIDTNNLSIKNHTKYRLAAFRETDESKEPTKRDSMDQPSNLNRLMQMASQWGHRASTASCRSSSLRRRSNQQSSASKSSPLEVAENDQAKLPSINCSNNFTSIIKETRPKTSKNSNARKPQCLPSIWIETNRVSLPSYQMSSIDPSARRPTLLASKNSFKLGTDLLPTTKNSSSTFQWQENRLPALETN